MKATMELETVNNVDDYIPLTPGHNIEFGKESPYQLLQIENTLTDVFDNKSEKKSDYELLLEKYRILEKKNEKLTKQNAKLQKLNEETQKLGIVYQKRFLQCTCKNSTLPPAENQAAASPTVRNVPDIPDIPETTNDIKLTSTQEALLQNHLHPTLKLGMLVGDLAVMIFPPTDLSTKTASTLDPTKLLFMMGKSK